MDHNLWQCFEFDQVSDSEEHNSLGDESWVVRDYGKLGETKVPGNHEQRLYIIYERDNYHDSKISSTV